MDQGKINTIKYIQAKLINIWYRKNIPGIYMDSRMIIRVAKKGAIYLPRRILRELKISEGDYLIARVKDDKIILEVLPDPFLLAVKEKKWAETSVEEFEEESLREQEAYAKGSS